tara:strand:+ start:451 stop:1434 length:984 start_codon:yes stop_codon:yes gene_type:complete
MNYLVTGAVGFIGYHTSKRILENSTTDKVYGIDNINNFYDVKLKKARLADLEKHPNFKFHKFDLTQKKEIESNYSFFKNIEAVIHLSAYAGIRTSIIDPWSYQDNNVNATINILEMCKNLNISNFILASTSSVYGDNKSLPTKETDQNSYPLSPYAASKISAELMTYTYHYHFNINSAILRFFTVYGPFGRPDMVIFKFMKSILDDRPITIYGDGEQTRDFTYVTDVADALISSSKIKGYEIFNIGGGNAITVNKLVKVIENFLNKKAQIKYVPRDPSDIEHSLADITKIKSNLKWAPQNDITKGVFETGKWFLNNQTFINSIKLQE